MQNLCGSLNDFQLGIQIINNRHVRTNARLFGAETIHIKAFPFLATHTHC